MRSSSASLWQCLCGQAASPFTVHAIFFRRECYCLQVAALAEFRADWATAVKTYQAAYLELLRIPQVGQLPLQRWTELTSVAEVMHLKVMSSCPHVSRYTHALSSVTLLHEYARTVENRTQCQHEANTYKVLPQPRSKCCASDGSVTAPGNCTES